MTTKFKNAVKGHEQIFANSDEYFIDIAWNDIPEFCEVMEKLVTHPLQRETVRIAKHYHTFLTNYGESISDAFYSECDMHLWNAMEALGNIVKANL